MTNTQDRSRHQRQINHILNNITDYVNGQPNVEEMHLSRNGTVRYVEIPITRQANNRQQTDEQAERRRRHQIQRTDSIAPQPDPRRVRFNQRAPQPPQPTEEELRIRAERAARADQALRERIEEREATRESAITAIKAVMKRNCPDFSQMFDRIIDNNPCIRYAAEINDPCYSCSFNYLRHGMLEIAKRVNKPLYEEAMRTTLHRGETTFSTDRLLAERGFMSHTSSTINDIIFDISSIVHAIGCNHHDCNERVPVFVSVDAENYAYFDGIRMFKFSKPVSFNNGLNNGLIFLFNVKKTDDTKHLFPIEKEFFQCLKTEMWERLLFILRNEFKLFNEAPLITRTLRRTNSNDNLNGDILITDVTGEQRTVEWRFSPRTSPRTIHIDPLHIEAHGVGINGGIVLKHKKIHKRRRDITRRVDYRDHDQSFHHDPDVRYRPVCMSRYIKQHNIDKNLSEDDGNV